MWDVEDEEMLVVVVGEFGAIMFWMGCFYPSTLVAMWLQLEVSLVEYGAQFMTWRSILSPVSSLPRVITSRLDSAAEALFIVTVTAVPEISAAGLAQKFIPGHCCQTKQHITVAGSTVMYEVRDVECVMTL